MPELDYYASIIIDDFQLPTSGPKDYPLNRTFAFVIIYPLPVCNTAGLPAQGNTQTCHFYVMAINNKNVVKHVVDTPLEIVTTFLFVIYY